MTQPARDKRRPVERLLALTLVGAPAAGFVGAIAYSALVRFDPLDLWLCLGMYLLTALGITAGFHRLFAHRGYQAVAPLRALLAVLGDMAAQGPVVFWVASHRQHHRFSDQPGDPHSPRVGEHGGPAGFWHAHVGWVFRHDHEGWKRYVPDLLRDKTVVRIDRLYFLWVALGFAVPAAIGGLASHDLTGALGGLLWGGFARTFLWHHATWSVNSIGHLVGSRPYATADTSTNNGLCALVSLGEGWHNNHHAFPVSARHGLLWWQLDVTWLTLKALAGLRLVSALHVPDARALAAWEAPPREAALASEETA